MYYLVFRRSTTESDQIFVAPPTRTFRNSNAWDPLEITKVARGSQRPNHRTGCEASYVPDSTLLFDRFEEAPSSNFSQ